MTSPNNVCVLGRERFSPGALSSFFVNFVVSKDGYGHPGIEGTPSFNLKRYVLPIPPLSHILYCTPINKYKLLLQEN